MRVWLICESMVTASSKAWAGIVQLIEQEDSPLSFQRSDVKEQVGGVSDSTISRVLSDAEDLGVLERDPEHPQVWHYIQGRGKGGSL